MALGAVAATLLVQEAVFAQDLADAAQVATQAMTEAAAQAPAADPGTAGGTPELGPFGFDFSSLPSFDPDDPDGKYIGDAVLLPILITVAISIVSVVLILVGPSGL